MKAPRNRSSKRDDLPDWAAEVQPDEDVMRLFYARTGQPRSGPLIIPRPKTQATAEEEDTSGRPAPGQDYDSSAPANTPAKSDALTPAKSTAEPAAYSSAPTSADIAANISADAPAKIAAHTGAITPGATTAICGADLPADSSARNTAQRPAKTAAVRIVSRAAGPAGSPAATAADSSLSDLGREVQEKGPFVPLDATHTSAEAKVYSIMYRQTISKGLRERHFSNLELMKATGLRSDNTVRVALKGLRAKLSIELIGHERFFRYGQHYRVYAPKEIVEARQKAKMVIEPKTKRILSSSVSYAAASAGSQASTSSRIEGHVPQELRDMLNHVNSDDEVVTSSSHEQFDEHKLAKVRNLFEQLSGGGTWKDDRDGPAFDDIAAIPLWHIIVGLCYSISRSTEHRMSSLAYAVPAIRQHFQQMESFPEIEMLEIAYRTMRRTLNCLETGKWTIPEWEAGSLTED